MLELIYVNFEECNKIQDMIEYDSLSNDEDVSYETKKYNENDIDEMIYESSNNEWIMVEDFVTCPTRFLSIN